MRASIPYANRETRVVQLPEVQRSHTQACTCNPQGPSWGARSPYYNMHTFALGQRRTALWNGCFGASLLFENCAFGRLGNCDWIQKGHECRKEYINDGN